MPAITPQLPALTSEQARQIAAEYIVKMTGGEKVDILETMQDFSLPEAQELLPRCRLFRASVLISLPPQEIIVAVDESKHSWLLPDEFNSWMLNAAIKADSAEQALLVAQLYLKLKSTGQVLVLHKATDIPYQERYWADPAPYQKVIRPPEAKAAAAGYKIDGYAWFQTGGSLVHWQFDIAENGTIQVIEYTSIADRIGDAVIVE